MIRKVNLNTPPGWARLTRLSLSNWSWKRRRPPGEYTQSMRLWDHGSMKNPALHCAEGAGPQPRPCHLISSEKSRDKRQRLRGQWIFDLWGPNYLLLFVDSWVPLIPKHILLLLQLVNLGFHHWAANVTHWQMFSLWQLPDQWPITQWPWLYILPPRISLFLKKFLGISQTQPFKIQYF